MIRRLVFTTVIGVAAFVAAWPAGSPLVLAEAGPAVEQPHLNLADRDMEDLVDSPWGLARMTKELIETGVRQQSDLSAAMANRLSQDKTNRLWQEQIQWRAAHPATW